MFSSNAFPSLLNDSTIFFFSCRHHLQQIPQQHPFLNHFQQEQQGVQGRLLSVAAAAWKGPRPSDHNKSSSRSRSIRRDDDDDGNHPPLVGYAKVFTTVEEKMGGSEGRGSSDTVESENWNQGSSRTPVLKGCKKKLGKRDHDRRRASNGASKSYVEEERSEAGRGGGRRGGGAELGFPLQRRKPWSAAAARNAAPAARGNSIQRNNHERISGGSEKKFSFRTGSAHHHNNTGQLLQERRRTEQSSSLKSCWPNNIMIPAAEVENLSLSTQGNAAAAAADDAQVVAVLDKEEVALREALKIRRKNTAEALCAALQAAKMSPRYSREVVATMPAFVDQIMLEAVALKGNSKFVTSSFASRARACIDQTKVVESIKWLKHNSVTMPRVGKLVDLKMENLQVLCERVAWLKHMHVHGRDLGVVLTRQPCILNRPQAELDELIGLLERAGIRREWVGFVISRSPGVLSLSSQELIKKLLFFENLGVTPQQLGPMAFNFPASIGHFHIDEMQTKVEYFRRLGLADPNIGRAIATRPQLLACSIDAAWRPLVKYLRFLGVETTGLQRIICVNPSVFCFNLENNIAPKVRFLRAIGVHEEAIGKIIVEFPAFLSFSLDRKIRPVVRFLLETAGVTEENVGKVIALQPRLIGCSMSNKLQPLVEYFLNHQLRRDQLGTMVADFPMLLKYNVSIIKPKLEYFKRVLALPFDDLIAFPRYFSYSLQGRINPRYRILRAKGLMFNLRYMLACSDDLFNQRVEAALQGHAIEASDEVDGIEGAYEDASGAHFPTDDDSIYAYAYHSCGDDTEGDEEYGSETEGDEDMSAATFLTTHD